MEALSPKPLLFPSPFLGFSDPLHPSSLSSFNRVYFHHPKSAPLLICSEHRESISNETPHSAHKGAKRERLLMRRNVLQGAEAIVSPELARVAAKMTNDSLGTVEHHPQNEYRTPPPQLGNPLHFYLPPVPCSTPARLHPMYHSARDACDSWLISTLKPQNEAYKQFLIQSMHPLFVCLTVPDALNKNIVPLCKLIAWLFVIDNFSDELLLMSGDLMSEKEYYDLVLCLLEGRAFLSSKDWNDELKEMSEVLLDVWTDIKANMSERQQKRFMNVIRDVFGATLTQSQMRQDQGIVELDTYLSFRKFTGEGYMFMMLAEIGNGLDLDDDILEHPDMMKLQELVAYHVAYVNDLLSFRKEFCLGHHQNLPSVLCVHEGYNMQESIFRVCRMIQALDDEFVSLRKKMVLNSALVEREGVRSYLEALGYVMSGFLEWAYQTGRYHGLNNYLTLRHGLVSLVHLDLTLITQGVVKSELFANN